MPGEGQQASLALGGTGRRQAEGLSLLSQGAGELEDVEGISPVRRGTGRKAGCPTSLAVYPASAPASGSMSASVRRSRPSCVR